MSIPFFTKEDNLTAFKKMKVVFLIKKIRMADFSIVMTIFFPFMLNLVIIGLISGSNDIWKFFTPFGSVFKAASTIQAGEWKTWYGSLHSVSILLSIFARIVLSWNLWLKMKRFVREHPTFSWERRDKFWLVVCMPFLSFVVYPILLKMTKFELSHKYNL